jgi:hypothetical protein
MQKHENVKKNKVLRHLSKSTIWWFAVIRYASVLSCTFVLFVDALRLSTLRMSKAEGLSYLFGSGLTAWVGAVFSRESALNGCRSLS